MTFTDDEIQALRTSFALCKSPAVKAAETFYANLFDAAPEMAGSFSTTSGPPKTMFWATLGLFIDNLEDLGSLRIPLDQLGKRHATLGANEKTYPVFADVLIGTIATICAQDWTLPHEDAWEKLLDHVVSTMMAAGRDASQTAA